MALTITRTADVYRLWIDEELRECFDSHAKLGWLCNLVAHSEDGTTTVWGVRMQLTNSKLPVISATLADVVVSDGSNVQALSVPDFNTANPDNQIIPGS